MARSIEAKVKSGNAMNFEYIQIGYNILEYTKIVRDDKSSKCRNTAVNT